MPLPSPPPLPSSEKRGASSPPESTGLRLMLVGGLVICSVVVRVGTISNSRGFVGNCHRRVCGYEFQSFFPPPDDGAHVPLNPSVGAFLYQKKRECRCWRRYTRGVSEAQRGSWTLEESVSGCGASCLCYICLSLEWCCHKQSSALELRVVGLYQRARCVYPVRGCCGTPCRSTVFFIQFFRRRQNSYSWWRILAKSCAR